MGLFDKKGQSAPAAPKTQTQAQTQSEEKSKTDSSFAPSGFGTGTGKVSFSFDFHCEQQDDEDAILLRARSQAYIDIVASIDMMSSTDEEIIEQLREIVDEEILEEYSEMSIDEMMEELRLCFEEEMRQRELKLQALPKPVRMIGVFSKCFIGGCDVHAIDKCGNILEHYSISKKYKEEIELARKTYHENPNCRCIELYSNCICVVAQDGSVETIYIEIE